MELVSRKWSRSASNRRYAHVVATAIEKLKAKAAEARVKVTIATTPPKNEVAFMPGLRKSTEQVDE